MLKWDIFSAFQTLCFDSSYYWKSSSVRSDIALSAKAPFQSSRKKWVRARPVLIMFVTRQIIVILFIFSICWSSFCVCDQDLETRARYIQLMGILKPLNTRDRLTTRLNYIGANLKSTKNLILYSSITSNEECVLKRFDQVEERCEELDRRVCKQGE